MDTHYMSNDLSNKLSHGTPGTMKCMDTHGMDIPSLCFLLSTSMEILEALVLYIVCSTYD